MKTLMQKLHSRLWMACVFAIAFSSCSENSGLSEDDGSTGKWPLMSVDPNQTWMTSQTIQLDITIDKEADITVQTIKNEKVTILGQKHFKQSGVMFVDVPQGIGSSFGVVYDDAVSPKQYRQIKMESQTKVIDVNFQTVSASRGINPNALSSISRAATASSLYGNSYINDCGYLNFGPWGWGDVQSVLEEAKNAKNNISALIDYEIKTNTLVSGGEYMGTEDDILLSFLYGHTGQTGARILGYYYRSPGKFDDIEFKDIAEVLTLDYYNGKAKVQYQLDGISTWYDANFDYRDDPAKPSQSPANSLRLGDDAWNTLNIYKYYGDRVTAIRGITFKLSIPKGKVFGFYLRSNDRLDDTQKKILKNLGVPNSKLPVYSANYSWAAMNTGNSNFRSAIAIYDNFTFMGMEDNISGGDYDCNDVTFALSNTKGEKYIPTFTDETADSKWNEGTIDKHPEYITPPSQGETNLQTWTLAFENAGLDNDYDFNDVVLKVTPNTFTHKAGVQLLAAGAQRRTEVYYDNTLLGEVHGLFGVDTKTMVNTRGNTCEKEPILLDSINWPQDATVETQRMNFSLKVYNEDGVLDREFSMTDLLNNKKSPQALCIAGDWQWPKETINIYKAYPLIGEWGINFNSEEYSNWYAFPNVGTVINPKKQ